MLRLCMCGNLPGAQREKKQRETLRQESYKTRKKEKKIVKEREDFKEREKITFEIILSSISPFFKHWVYPIGPL